MGAVLEGLEQRVLRILPRRRRLADRVSEAVLGTARPSPLSRLRRDNLRSACRGKGNGPDGCQPCSRGSRRDAAERARLPASSSSVSTEKPGRHLIRGHLKQLDDLAVVVEPELDAIGPRHQRRLYAGTRSRGGGGRPAHGHRLHEQQTRSEPSDVRHVGDTAGLRRVRDRSDAAD
jgi:hypothetical protein